MNGKLIVIDGLDGSGKSTQAQLLWERLQAKYPQVMLLSYPDYAQPSSTLVKMYLNGDFSKDAADVNAYAASTFYAIDRYASFMQFWKQSYQSGAILIASRYVSSNAIHQMVKLPEAEWDGFLTWLHDFEYQKLGLPKADSVLFLDMPRVVANRLILSRYQGDESKKDIHESNLAYLEQCQKSASYAAKKQGWTIIPCSDGKEAYSIEQVSEAIDREIEKLLN